LNDKLLIFNKEDAIKADLVYDIHECAIKSHKLEEDKFSLTRPTLLKSSSIIYYYELGHTTDFTSSVTSSMEIKRNNSLSNILKYSSLESLESSEKCLLNYEIEIEHPYLSSCFLRGEFSTKSLTFYEQLMQVK